MFDHEYDRRPAMAEMKRVLLGRKSLTLLIIVIFLHAVFFFYQCNDVKRDTLSGTELEEYVNGYQEYVSGVLTNAEEMLENPLFSNKNSHVYRNLVKTKQDFQGLLDITPIVGENRGVMAMIPFRLTGYLMLLMGIYYVLCFMAERQKGLYLLVRCTSRGRFPLSLERVFTLILGLFITGSLLFLTVLPVAMLRFPGANLSRPIQSIPEFSGVLSHVSIFGYLCLIMLRKILGCIVTCMLLYFCMSLLRSSLCILLFLGIFLGEYLLYALLLPTDRLCILKYVNLYTLIFSTQDYAHYYNMNFFGHPVLTGTSSDLVAAFAFLAFSLLALWQFAHQYPKAEGKRFPLLDRISAIISKKKPQLSPFLWECKKILFSQKALLILCMVLYLAWSSSQEISYRDYRSTYVLHWYEEFQGKIDETKLKDMQKQMDKLVKKLGKLEASLQHQQELLPMEIQKGHDTSKIAQNIASLMAAIREYNLNIKGLTEVQEHAQANYEFTKSSGITVDLLDPTCYELLLSKDYQTVRQNYLYVLLAVIFMFSGVMAIESSSNVKPLLHVLPRGGRPMLLRKLAIVFLLSVICALFIHFIQYIQIGKILPYHSMDAVIQSIPCVHYLPIIMTIRTYLILLYAFRCFLAFLLGIAVMTISHYSKNRSNTIALSVFLLVIPMVLLSYFFLATGA